MSKYNLSKEEFQQLQIDYQRKVESIANRPYKEQRGWGLVKIVIDTKLIAPLCKHPYPGHPKGCLVRCNKRYCSEIVDITQKVWAIYYSMNLEPLWSKLRKKWPHWTEAQVQNLRYWGATRKKLLRKLEYEFLKEHPGPWVRVLDRAPKHINYTFGLWYNKTMEQIDVKIPWPPGAQPLLVEFLGRSIRDDLDPVFILSEETVKNPAKRPYKKPNQISDQEHADFVDMATDLKSEDLT